MTQTEPHEVLVLCSCDNVEQCRTEVYVADVRIAWVEVQRLYRRLEAIARIALA